MTNDALNRAVAEHVMGWQERTGFDDGNGNFCWTLHPLPDYANDPRLTMQVVEKMRETHFIRVEFERERCIVGMRLNPPTDGLGWERANQEGMGRAVAIASLRARKIATEGL